MTECAHEVLFLRLQQVEIAGHVMRGGPYLTAKSMKGLEMLMQLVLLDTLIVRIGV